MLNYIELISIALGGALGTLLRLGITRFCERVSTPFPMGTLLANLAGCLSMGIVVALASCLPNLRSEIRSAITVGFLGGLTTFSTFSLESFLFLSSGRHLTALIHLVLHNALGIGAIWLGYRATQRILGV